jgi:hypothetical protein
MTRRMRLAMEIDCDARVLRGTDAIREYGMLLLAVHARRGRTLPLVASLTEQRALLERRILAMTASRPGYPRVVSAAFGLVACAAAIAVAQTPVPQGADGRAVVGSATTRDDIGRQARALMQKLVTDYYPAVTQGTSPINRITFVLDEDGNYVTSAAWTDTAVARRSTAAMPTAVAEGSVAPRVETQRAFEGVRMVAGFGRGGEGGRSVSRPQSDGVRDFGAYGFPNITSDAVMNTQSGWSFAPTPLSVFIIRLKK